MEVLRIGNYLPNEFLADTNNTQSHFLYDKPLVDRLPSGQGLLFNPSSKTQYVFGQVSIDACTLTDGITQVEALESGSSQPSIYIAVATSRILTIHLHRERKR